MAGLESLRTPDEVAELRGLSINQVLGLTGEPTPTRAGETISAERRAADERCRGRRGAEEARHEHAEGHAAQVANGSDKRQLDTLRSLGLRRIGQTVEVNDTPQMRGHAPQGPPPGRGGRSMSDED